MIVVKFDGEAFEAYGRVGTRLKEELPGHSQVNDEGSLVVEIKHQVFAAAADADDPAAGQLGRRLLWEQGSHDTWMIGEPDALYRSLEERTFQGASDCFHFG